MKSVLVPASIGGGVLLVILSLAWPTLFPASARWSNEQAARRSAIQDRLHVLGFQLSAPQGRPSMHSHAPAELQTSRGTRDLAELKTEYDQLMEENNQLNAEFESAYNQPRTIASILKWGGVSLAVLGVIGWYATKQS